MPEGNNLRENVMYLLRLIVSKVLVHYGEQNKTEQNRSYLGGQEACVSPTRILICLKKDSTYNVD
jgi:hypothetical protein